jgi:hypothetical protein
MKIRHAKASIVNKTCSRKCPLFPGQKLEGFCEVYIFLASVEKLQEEI